MAWKSLRGAVDDQERCTAGKKERYRLMTSRENVSLQLQNKEDLMFSDWYNWVWIWGVATIYHQLSRNLRKNIPFWAVTIRGSSELYLAQRVRSKFWILLWVPHSMSQQPIWTQETTSILSKEHSVLLKPQEIEYNIPRKCSWHLLSLGVFLLGENRVERSSSHHSGLKFSPRKAQPAFCRRKAPMVAKGDRSDMARHGYWCWCWDGVGELRWQKYRWIRHWVKCIP